MYYHNILHDDMRNGEGLRVVLFVSGCQHHCSECHNIETWPVDSGIEFDAKAYKEIIECLELDHIAGITFSGGDPLHVNNCKDVMRIANEVIKRKKTVWLYTGYVFEEVLKNGTEDQRSTLSYVDVLVDGKFDKELADINYKWAGSTNQRIIDVKKSLEIGEVVLYQ